MPYPLAQALGLARGTPRTAGNQRKTLPMVAGAGKEIAAEGRTA
jgi:hypothetical protein